MSKYRIVTDFDTPVILQWFLSHFVIHRGGHVLGYDGGLIVLIDDRIGQEFELERVDYL